MDFNQWKKEVMDELANRGLGHIQPDEEALYMAFSMECKTASEAVEELIQGQPD